MTENVNPEPATGEGATEPLPSPEADPVVLLAHLIPALWRTMRRATRAATQLPANESQVTILRMLVLYGQRTPSELAEEMRIARATLSNLLKDLVRTGLVERSTVEGDHRSVVLSAAPAGREVLETFRRDRAEALRMALAQLPVAEREALLQGVGPLRHLQRQLEVVADGAGAETDSKGA